jgi:hypothetical protein
MDLEQKAAEILLRFDDFQVAKKKTLHDKWLSEKFKPQENRRKLILNQGRLGMGTDAVSGISQPTVVPAAEAELELARLLFEHDPSRVEIGAEAVWKRKPEERGILVEEWDPIKLRGRNHVPIRRHKKTEHDEQIVKVAGRRTWKYPPGTIPRPEDLAI